MTEFKAILDIPENYFNDYCYEFKGNDPVVIYGAGYCGAMFCELLQDNGVSPVCFFDKNNAKHGNTIMGVPISYPQVLIDAAQYLVIVCILQKGNLFKEIRKYLNDMGYMKVIHITDLKNDKKLFSKQKLIISPDVNSVKANILSIEKVNDCLMDSMSRETYLSIIKFLLGDSDLVIPSLPMRQQYFAYDIYSKNKDEVFLDCGAFKGDVMDIFFENNNHEYSRYYAIEPDLEYIKTLEQKKYKYSDSRINIINSAVSNSSKQLRIQNYGNENSVICDNGENTVNCDTLDKLAYGVCPTFIKIDVEGFEQQVLAGAEKTINEFQPVIAIAIYHSEKDFWEIPLLIKEKYPFYSLYIRSYMNVHETILYAVPDNRRVLPKQ